MFFNFKVFCSPDCYASSHSSNRLSDAPLSFKQTNVTFLCSVLSYDALTMHRCRITFIAWVAGIRVFVSFHTFLYQTTIGNLKCTYTQFTSWCNIKLLYNMYMRHTTTRYDGHSWLNNTHIITANSYTFALDIRLFTQHKCAYTYSFACIIIVYVCFKYVSWQRTVLCRCLINRMVMTKILKCLYFYEIVMKLWWDKHIIGCKTNKHK